MADSTMSSTIARPGPLHALHEARGARFEDGAGRRLVQDYGDPAAEYAAAHGGAVVVDRSERALIRLHGRDPLGMVQGLVTNDVAGAPAGRAVYAAFLTPKGRMVADVRVLRRPDGDVWLETWREARDGLVAHLTRFVPPLFARREDLTESWGLLTVLGPSAESVVASAVGAVPAREAGEYAMAAGGLPGRVAGSELLVIRTLYAGVDGYDVLAPAGALESVWSALESAGARPAGRAVLEVLRIEAGRPRWGAELTEATIPLEAGLREGVISESKGCYTGQEVIVRILHRGHVNRHLRGLRLGAASVPPPGAVLVRAGETKGVGEVTSTCASPRWGEAIGLGYVRREIEPPARLALADSGAAVEVVSLPFEAVEAAGGEA